MLAGESTRVIDGTLSDIEGMFSRDRGDRSRERPCCARNANESLSFPSETVDETAGNLNVCGRDPDPFRLSNGLPGKSGVLGAVATPGWRLVGVSASVFIGEDKELRGDDCVADRWFMNAKRSERLPEQ